MSGRARHKWRRWGSSRHPEQAGRSHRFAVMHCSAHARGSRVRRCPVTMGSYSSKTKGPLHSQQANSRVPGACHIMGAAARAVRLTSVTAPDGLCSASEAVAMDDTHNEHVEPRGSPARGARGRPLHAEELLESALKRGGRRDFADRTFISPFEHL